MPNITKYCGTNNRWRLNNKTLSRAIETEVYQYAHENLAIINIFIKESYTKRFRKAEKMSRISYIASSGGLLGLCMGFSFVSLAEIAYHIFLCCGLMFRTTKSLRFHYSSRRHEESANRRSRNGSGAGGNSASNGSQTSATNGAKKPG